MQVFFGFVGSAKSRGRFEGVKVLSVGYHIILKSACIFLPLLLSKVSLFFLFTFTSFPPVDLFCSLCVAFYKSVIFLIYTCMHSTN